MAPVFKLKHKRSGQRPPLRDYAADEACAVTALQQLRHSRGGFCISELPPPSPPPTRNLSLAIAKKGRGRAQATANGRVYNCNKCTASFKSPQALGGHQTCHRSKPTVAAAARKGGSSAAGSESGRVLPSESLPESSSMAGDRQPSSRRGLDIDLNLPYPFDD